MADAESQVGESYVSQQQQRKPADSVAPLPQQDGSQQPQPKQQPQEAQSQRIKHQPQTANNKQIAKQQQKPANDVAIPPSDIGKQPPHKKKLKQQQQKQHKSLTDVAPQSKTDVVQPQQQQTPKQPKLAADVAPQPNEDIGQLAQVQRVQGTLPQPANQQSSPQQKANPPLAATDQSADTISEDNTHTPRENPSRESEPMRFREYTPEEEADRIEFFEEHLEEARRNDASGAATIRNQILMAQENDLSLDLVYDMISRHAEEQDLDDPSAEHLEEILLAYACNTHNISRVRRGLREDPAYAAERLALSRATGSVHRFFRVRPERGAKQERTGDFDLSRTHR